MKVASLAYCKSIGNKMRYETSEYCDIRIHYSACEMQTSDVKQFEEIREAYNAIMFISSLLPV